MLYVGTMQIMWKNHQEGKMKEQVDTVKVLALNAASGMVSMANVEMGLKLTLLVFSIVYTGLRIHEIYKKNRNANTNKESNRD